MQEEYERKAEAAKKRLSLSSAETQAEMAAQEIQVAESLQGTEMEELIRSVAEQEAILKLQAEKNAQQTAK